MRKMTIEEKLKIVKQILINDYLEIDEQIKNYSLDEVDETEFDVCQMEYNGLIDLKLQLEKVNYLIGGLN